LTHDEREVDERKGREEGELDLRLLGTERDLPHQREEPPETESISVHSISFKDLSPATKTKIKLTVRQIKDPEKRCRGGGRRERNEGGA